LTNLLLETDHANGGFIGEGAIGLAYQEDVCTSTLRAELAFSFQQDTIDDSEGDFDVETMAVMVNGYFDLYTETDFTPYLLAGIGRANVDDGSDDTYTFAYQFGAGLGYSVTEHIILDLKYKYFGTDDSDIIPRLTTQQVLFGVRYQF